MKGFMLLHPCRWAQQPSEPQKAACIPIVGLFNSILETSDFSLASVCAWANFGAVWPWGLDHFLRCQPMLDLRVNFVVNEGKTPWSQSWFVLGERPNLGKLYCCFAVGMANLSVFHVRTNQRVDGIWRFWWELSRQCGNRRHVIIIDLWQRKWLCHWCCEHCFYDDTNEVLVRRILWVGIVSLAELSGDRDRTMNTADCLHASDLPEM